jgi:LysM repeat protein
MQRRFIFGLFLGLASLALSACFRDAGNEQNRATSIPLELQATASPEVRLNIPTFTPAPQQSPSPTLVLGGPPINPSPTIRLEDTPSDTLANTLAPTQAIPSFTPRPGSFGDSGITPTPRIPTQPVPDSFVTEEAERDLECVYLVQAGDTLFSITTELGVTVDEMLAINAALAANPNALQIDQELQIPNCVEGQGVLVESEAFGDAPTTAASPAASPSPNPDGSQAYTIQSGDTLFRIATQNNLTIQELLGANPGLTENSIIQPGQVIIIPAPSQ